MPPTLLVDLDRLDLSRILYDVKAIEEVNPHRYEMRQLDGIIALDVETGTVVGFKDVREDEFWVRGHIPERPLMPGVLLLESAAQLASFCVKKINVGENRFIGFGGLEGVKFRVQVTPGNRLYLLGKLVENRQRRFKLAAQGVVNGQLAFEAIIIGIPI